MEKEGVALVVLDRGWPSWWVIPVGRWWQWLGIVGWPVVQGLALRRWGLLLGLGWRMMSWVILSRWWCGWWLGSMGERWQEIGGGQGAGGVLVGSCLAGLSLAFRRLLGLG